MSQRSARPTAGRVQSFDAQVAELYRLLRYDVEAGKAVSDEPFDLYLTLNPGDVWVLGPHRLLCGDATVAASRNRLSTFTL